MKQKYKYHLYRVSVKNQLLQLFTARTIWSDPVIRPDSVRKSTTQLVTSGKQRKKSVNLLP